MGFMDAFNAEDRITVKVTSFGSLVKEAAKAELMMNAVNCDVPHRYIREMMTGTKEEEKELEVAVPMGMMAKVLGDIMDDMITEVEENGEAVRTPEESTGADS